ncbi:MAG: hypothetical protein AB1918_11550, partial [Pseudomonadota bacterium]
VANDVRYLESSSAMGATAQDYRVDGSSGAALIVIGAGTGTGGVQVWYTENQAAASTANSYQIATIDGIALDTVSDADVTLSN